MPLAMLEEMLGGMATSTKTGVVDFGTRDDCAIYPQAGRGYLMFTMDIITPVANDPFSFGQIAAANALSDIYATGGVPVMALSFLAFPVGVIDSSVASEIQRGSMQVLAEADCPLVGGHTLDDKELKYGLAVVGKARKRELLLNSGAQPGDLLVLTKPLGNGVIIKALKDGIWNEQQFMKCRSWMVRLNREGLSLARKLHAHACVDVTGYGLGGHALWMAKASGVTIEIETAWLPVLNGVRDLVRRGVIPRGAKNNRAYLEPFIDGFDRLPEETKWILCDPQTSGGLLVAVSPHRLHELGRIRKRDGVPRVIGRVVSHLPGSPYLTVSF